MLDYAAQMLEFLRMKAILFLMAVLVVLQVVVQVLKVVILYFLP